MKTWPALSLLLLAGCSGLSSTPTASTPAAPASAPVAMLGTAKAHNSSLADMQPGQVKAFIVMGNIQLIHADGTRSLLTRGETFTEGNTVLAGPHAHGLLVLSNGATIKISPNTLLQVTQFKQAKFNEAAEGSYLRLARDPSRSVTQLDFKNGAFEGEVKPINTAAGSSFEVNTPTGSMYYQNGKRINNQRANLPISDTQS